MLTLLKPLELIKVAQKSKGALEETHCRFWAGWVAASNSIISCAHPVPVDFMTCPETNLLIKAIKEGKKEQLSFTLDNNQLSVNSEKYQVTVPCINHDQLPPICPDTQKFLLDNSFLDSIVDAGEICLKTKSPITELILIDGSSCYATNGQDAIQIFNGFDIGVRMFLPVEFSRALVKWQDKKLISIGWSETSLTLMFDDGAWIKTQLYPSTIPYPDYKGVLCSDWQGSVYWPSKPFYDALKHFKRCGAVTVHFEHNAMHSEAVKTVIPIEGLYPCGTINIEALLAVQNLSEKLSFHSVPKLVLWQGKTSRGVIGKHD